MTTQELSAMIERVRLLISAQHGIAVAKITADSRIEEDLRISGDDHVELMDHLFEVLEINPGDFSYKRYVSAEGLSLFGTFSDRLRGKRREPQRPITVRMIAQAALDGLWSTDKLEKLLPES